MKLAFVSQPEDIIDPRNLGGSIPTLTYQIARRLAQSGEIVIYSKRGQRQSRFQLANQGFQIKRVSTKVEHWLLRSTKLLKRLIRPSNSRRPLFSSDLYYLGYILRIALDIKKEQCDIVHVHNFSQFIPVIRAFNPEAKIVLHMHCEWLTQLNRDMIDRRLKKVDLVIGCSDYITQKIRDIFPQYQYKCRTLMNGVDVDHFKSTKSREKSHKAQAPNLLYVGRISPEKGVHVLLEAYALVAKRSPGSQLNIVGPSWIVPFDFVISLTKDVNVIELKRFYAGRLKRGHYFPLLEERIPRNLRKQVHFIGNLPHSQLVDFYRKADVFIFPPVWNEPFGMPLVEAMACEVPVVATQSGGVVEIVEQGVTGLLVERGNAKMLADAIIQLLKDNRLRRSMGKAGRRRVIGHFTWIIIAQNLLEYYTNLFL
jgi:glycosyltransferase involved in cell wall biosynthesis